MQFIPEIITIKSNVQFPVLNFIWGNLLFYFLYDLVGKINTARLDADQDCIIQIYMTFQNLVSQSFYGNSQLLFGKN
jgi:hypothetical protein